MTRTASFVLLVTCAFALDACVVEPDRGPPAGTLVVDWTLNDSKDPGQCAASGAQDLDVIVRNGGVLIGDFVTSCEDFSESIRLGSGTYDVDAVLLDSAGNDRTTAVPIGPVQIFGGDQLVVPVNFPSDSFL